MDSAQQRIAIVSMGGVLPALPSQANDIDTFWANVKNAVSVSRPVTPGRWLLHPDDAYDDEAARPDKVYSVRGCFIDDPTCDPAGLNIDAALLAKLDPVFHIGLRAARQALTEAKMQAVDRRRVGVIIGNIALPTDSASTMAMDVLGSQFDAQVTGRAQTSKALADPINRYVAGLPGAIISKAFNLGGGCYTLDAACASSLYALKLAYDELIAGRADAMLTGGMSRPDCLYTQMGFSQLRALSASGLCSPFDQKADGLVVGEGAGFVMLKRLDDALADGDHIYATIAGIGLSNDIGGSLFGPDSEGQLRAMRKAYGNANWSPADIDLIECHGTGTPTGDAVELQSLRTMWKGIDQPCVIGSVKSNVGHLLTGAGGAGLIKTLLAMRDGELPPTANYQQAAGEMKSFRVLGESQAWQQRDNNTPRRAAISAFGFGGINAHVLLEQWQEAKPHTAVMVKTPAPAPKIAIIGIGEQFGDSQSSTTSIGHIDFPLQRFRIPPSELKQMLPQQLLMLQVAAQAFDDAGVADADHVDTGVFVGIELDMNTTNFHLRWSLLNKARSWGVDLTDQQQDQWLTALRDACSPPLSADRTMGALGGIVASRVARAFHIGGQSFTISCEQCSGVRAIEAAVRALQLNELDLALASAVDLNSDPRTNAGPLPADGAGALILKRLDDAVADGDNIYAVISGAGAATGDGATTTAQMRACQDAQIDDELSAVTIESDLNLGAATGAASVIKAVKAIKHCILPAIDTKPEQYWLHNRIDGPRRAHVTSQSIGDSAAHLILEEHLVSQDQLSPRPLDEKLYAVTSDDPGGLVSQLIALRTALKPAANIDTSKKLAVTILARDESQLKQRIDSAVKGLQRDPAEPIDNDSTFYSPIPLQGQVAFVYPGSGNHFEGMGREHALHFPQALSKQEEENQRLADQYTGGGLNSDDLESLIFAQVSLGTLVTDVMTGFGIQPNAVIGYSLGETAGLFSTRAWTDRDEMLKRMQASKLFKTQLAGDCESVRTAWALDDSETVNWTIGVVDRSSEMIQKMLVGRNRVYLLIVNTPRQCVIGGQRDQVMALIKEIGCVFHELDGITTVHCEVARPVQEAYRDLHLFNTSPMQGVRYYSGILGRSYELTRESAGDSIVGQAVEPFDYTKVIESAYEDGVRIFIEMGPGASCTRMIDEILGDRPRAAMAACVKGQNGSTSVLRVLARLITERVEVDLHWLMEDQPEPPSSGSTLSIPVGVKPYNVPPKPQPAIPVMQTVAANPILQQAVAVEAATATAHQTFLDMTAEFTQTMTRALSGQISGEPTVLEPVVQSAAFDREMCMAFAIGSVGQMLGSDFAAIDSHPSRVRLPDEPLMLVDRIIEVEGEPLSMTSGRVVTEHDIYPGAWYLDGGRIPTCIAVEAGQADLFLSGYLGIDYQTKGLAVYRLLDAEITFHRELPGSGGTIHYDIHIDQFFRQGDTWLFRFHFDATINGQPLLMMRKGVAGFFTQEELEAGRGIVHTELDLRKIPGTKPDDWRELAPISDTETYSDAQLMALRQGDVAECYGSAFANLPLRDPYTLPGATGRMKLVDRVIEMDHTGGRYGLGRITAEMDVHPDDWFLTCHFCDDMVMPGTLMYECCMHTLRLYLLRLGWVGENGEVVCEPVPGEASKLKCRGQVLASTKKVTYEISVKELGYTEDDGTPYCLADAVMYADGRAIVEMTNMSLCYSGLKRQQLEMMWARDTEDQVLFDHESILQYATGKPSLAFGDRYKPFDEDRIIARLPAPPYNVMHRVTRIESCEPWQLKAGGEITAHYDVDPDEWYFAADRQPTMPFAILLEVALQPCGWLAGYLGSALTSDIDMSFRNLGGKAVQHRPVERDAGTLTTQVKITGVSKSGGMIIQNFDYAVSDRHGLVYKGDTYFGFFSKEALRDQVGLRDIEIYQESTSGAPGIPGTPGESLTYPQHAPFPDDMMRMIDHIDQLVVDGGPNQLGYIRATKNVDPDDWFFKAHFYQDPVCPGSLGLESMLQLMKVLAAKRFGVSDNTRFESMVRGHSHQWVYRGQILPTDRQVTVSAIVTGIDESAGLVRCDGLLSVDGRHIYQMTDFTIKISP